MNILLEQIKQNPFYIFIFLYWINLLLDYSLQSEFLATYKAKSNYILFVHSAIWGIGITFGLMIFGFAYIPLKLAFLVFGHMLIDAWKCRGWYKKLNISDWHSLYIDQSLHIVQILVCMIF